VIIPSWDPQQPVYVLRRSLPTDVDRRVLRRGYLFANADLEAPTPTEFVADGLGLATGAIADRVALG
jgi:hypothetical protein